MISSYDLMVRFGRANTPDEIRPELRNGGDLRSEFRRKLHLIADACLKVDGALEHDDAEELAWALSILRVNVSNVEVLYWSLE